MDSIIIDRRPLSKRDWAIDAGIALFAFVLGVLQMALSSSPLVFSDNDFRELVAVSNVVQQVSSYIMLAFTTLPLVLRRRFPWPVFVFTFLVFLTAQGNIPLFSLAIVGPMVALFTIAHQRPRIEVILAAAVALLGTWLAFAPRVGESLTLLSRIQDTSYLVIAVIAGIALHSYENYIQAANERAMVAEKGRAEEVARHDEEAARRIEEERVRIAREVHDITAHSLSAVSIQAAAAEKLIERNPEAAREAITQVRNTSKEALEEIRAMISVLRNEEGESAETAPTEGTDRVMDLCSYGRDAGLQVHLAMDDYDRSALPAYIDVAVFGILREAVTNVVRHAGASNVWITLESDARSVRLTVEDDGRGLPDENAGEGHGLVGMEERTRVLNGTFKTANRAEGGCAVYARIPLVERDAHA